MIQILQSGWMTVVIATLTFLATSAALISKQRFEVPVSAKSAGPAHDEMPKPIKPGPSWDYYNPEVDQLVESLKKEREVLLARERELNALAKSIENQKSELNQITQRVFQMQQEFDKNVIRVKEDEVVNLKKLAKMYSTMSPAGAANIFKEMDDEQIVKYMLYMKEAEVGPILEALALEKPQATMSRRAATITNRLRLASTKPTAAAKPKPK